VWSPDGNFLAFSSRRKGGNQNLYRKPVNNPGAEEELWVDAENKDTTDWSPDGRFLLYEKQSQQTQTDLWALPMTGERKPFVVAQTSAEEYAGRFSPDGRWVAYVSNESGRNEAYVQAFPTPGRKRQISTTGASTTAVEWNRNGKELFYSTPDDRLM